MRLARALGSLPHLRRQFVPAARSRVVQGRLQWNFRPGLEEPAQKVSSVDVKATLADQTPLASSLRLWMICALTAGLVVVTLIPNLILGVIFCVRNLLAELRGRWRRGRIARAIDSRPHLRRQLVPTVRSRPRRRPLQGNFNTAIEKPTQGISWVNVQPRLPDQTTPLPSPTLSLIRALVAGLVLAALIPNLMLGAIFWLGAGDIPRSRSITANDKPVPPESAVPTPVLSSPPTLEASAKGDITLPIALDGTDGVPARSIIAIKGLPQGSKLSSGRPYDETEWNLKPDEIGDLHLVLPRNASGEAKLLMQLVAPDGAIIADAATVLKMPANSVANIGASDTKTEPTEAQVLNEPAETLGTTGAEERVANLDAAMETPGDLVPLPLRRPAQTSNDDANSITLTSVNLRERPTRSAPAIGVVAKGTKLRLIARKRGWVQVTNLETSEEGWIYARHVATVR
jgi:SH3 domain-containing protein